MGTIAIVDYGVGNLKSVSNAMSYLGFSTQIIGEAAGLERADAIILPGVGAFPDAADRLREQGLDQVLIAQTETKPVLGICLGMQLLFEMGHEVRSTKGLGLIAGRVEQITTSQKLPHIGWNSLRFSGDCPLFRDFSGGEYVYFVHSYCGCVDREEDAAAWTDYGVPVLAAVHRGNVFGCQFHPEKSGDVGLQILHHFGELSK